MDAKTAVDTIFVGRDRAYNRRFQQMCGHYLVDPVACTPASGWEKGQVENQVGVVRRRFFVPRPKFKSYAELDAWLEDRCAAWAKANPHQELRDRTIWDVFQDERASLVPYVGPFDHCPAGASQRDAAERGLHAVPASVSTSGAPPVQG
ncbi:Mobile element protein [Salipiger mucosus DSM 16094]|uniref:Mobile element protein n=1 Tax=Salipiger mucosus DSM 16094 TaxID=1123237 RepID=S9RCD5_9RHOB|nr:Mobile element protein [Salipiger mucosus DSM 16094]